MLHVILGHHIASENLMMDAIWRFRHQRFVEDLGWQALRRDDGLERDAFDTPATVHIAVARHGEVLGYSRLLPTTSPHLLSSVFPELAPGGDYPRGPRVVEWGRYAISKGPEKLDGVSVADTLMTGVLEYLVSAGIETVIIEASLELVRMLRRRGYPVRVLGHPIEIDGELVIAIAATPSYELLEQHRARYRIVGSLLDLPDCVSKISDETAVHRSCVSPPGACSGVRLG